MITRSQYEIDRPGANHWHSGTTATHYRTSQCTSTAWNNQPDSAIQLCRRCYVRSSKRSSRRLRRRNPRGRRRLRTRCRHRWCWRSFGRSSRLGREQNHRRLIFIARHPSQKSRLLCYEFNLIFSTPTPSLSSTRPPTKRTRILHDRNKNFRNRLPQNSARNY